MTKILFTFLAFSFFSLSSSYASNCIYGLANQCPQGFYCVNVDKDKVECREESKLTLLSLPLPFQKNTPVWCDQGPLSPAGNSHTWWNTAFALDLQSQKSKPAAKIVASMDGTAIVFDGCKTKNDDCGAGFGNHVKVMTENGYIVFYAHLEKVLVKTGQKVKRGDVLGIEGLTGLTGDDNRHLHFSLHYDWRPMGFDYWKQVGFLPSSVPFKLNFCDGSCGASCKTKDLDIRNLPCRRSGSDPKPLCN